MIRPWQLRSGDWPGEQILARCLGEYERSHDDRSLDFLFLLFVTRFNFGAAVLNPASFQDTLDLLKLVWFGFEFHRSGSSTLSSQPRIFAISPPFLTRARRVFGFNPTSLAHAAMVWVFP